MKRFPAPGEGPSAAQRQKAFFRCRFVGETTDGQILQAGVNSRLDGYTATAVFVGECALGLAQDVAPTGVAANGAKGGVLTPATLLGVKLGERLKPNQINVV
jgi:short subunit dehydrogenase-like uncharacterized protein